MDKGKNRNDLLAAGRKKLQQYRKKNNKGSNSNSKGKNSEKNKDHEEEAVSSTNSDQLNPNLSSDNKTRENLGDNSGEVSVNLSSDIENSGSDLGSENQIVETETIPTSLDNVETLEIQRDQEEVLENQEIALSGSENQMQEIVVIESNSIPKEEISVENELELVEIIKRELYLSAISKDSIELQLDEQTGINEELSKVVKQTEEGLVQCKSELQETVIAKEKEKEKLCHALSEVKSQLEGLERENVSVKAEREGLVRENISMKEEREGLQRENISMKEEREGLVRENISMKEEREKLEGLERENISLKEERERLEGLERENICMKEEREKLEREREILSSENTKLNSELSDQKERLVRLESSIRETSTSFERLIEENVILSTSLDLHKLILIESEEKFNQISPNSRFLNLHMEEVKSILANFKTSIEKVQSGTSSGSFNKKSGISNLIKAFESNLSSSDEIPVIEREIPGSSDEHSLESTVHLAEKLELALNRLELDLIGETEGAEMKISEEERSKDEEYNNILQEKIEGLSVIFNNYGDKIENLQDRFASVKIEADDEARRLSSQLDELQRDMDGRIQRLLEERDKTVGAVSEAILKFNSCTGLSVPDELVHGGVDVSPNIFALVDSATQSIGKLCIENNMLSEKNEISIGFAKKMHDALEKLVNDSNHENNFGEKDLQLIFERYEGLVANVQSLVEERQGLLAKNKDLESGLMRKTKEAEEFSVKCESLAENLNDFCLIKGDLESTLMSKNQILEELYSKCIALVKSLPESSEISGIISGDMESDLLNSILPELEASISLIMEREKEEGMEIDLAKKCLYEANILSEISPDKWALALPTLLDNEFLPQFIEMGDKIDVLSASNIQLHTEIEVLRDSLVQMDASSQKSQTELKSKIMELEQSEQRLSSVKEKLGIAVSKGKGLIVQRDGLKQSIMEISSELERCKEKLKSSTVERIEALESELSYIRNSANVMRDSFLIRDSVIQRIEEVLEDFEFPEEFYAREIVEKIEFLAHMAVQRNSHSRDIAENENNSREISENENSREIAENENYREIAENENSREIGENENSREIAEDENSREIVENENSREIAEDENSRESAEDENSGEVQVELRQGSDPETGSGFDTEEFKNRYSALERKFYDLAEQSNMLEQSLHERNGLIQKWEEIIGHISIIPPLFSEPEERLKFLVGTLLDAQAEGDALHLKIESLEESSEMLIVDLEGSRKRISELNAEIAGVKSEKEFFSDSLNKLRFDYDVERETMRKQLAALREKISEKIEGENEIYRLVDFVRKALEKEGDSEELFSSNSVQCLDKLVRKLVEERTSLVQSVDNSRSIDFDETNALRSELDEVLEKNKSLALNLERLNEERAHLSEKHQEEIVALNARVDLFSEERAQASEALRESKEHHLHEVEVLNERIIVLELERDQEVEKRLQLVSELGGVGKQRDGLQEQLNQVREKLNIAVRKGKSLVQQRDGLKQQIETLENEKSSLSSQLEESSRSMSRIQTVLDSFDLGHDGTVSQTDPVQKLHLVSKMSDDLKSAVVGAENEAKKSRRATELLLVELNESQERADLLQEELERITRKKMEETRDLNLAIANLINASFEMLERLGVKVNKDVSLISYFESFVGSLATNQMDGPDVSSDFSSFVSAIIQDISSRKRNHIEYNASEPMNENIISYVYNCVQELGHFKTSIENEASLTDQRYENLFNSMSNAQKQVESLITDLREEMREKEKENSSITEERTKEFKSNIVQLQRELQEKELQVSRISAELSSQIRDGETKINRLEKRVDEVEMEKQTLQLRLTELEETEVSVNELRERVNHYTEILTKKEQEIESLMQALDEEEKEMEELETKAQRLESQLDEKDSFLKSLEASRSKTVTKLSTTVTKFDELHNLSENLLSEIESFQSQLDSKDSEISFLRQEITRITNELLSSDESNKKYSSQLNQFSKWLETLILKFGLGYEETEEFEFGKMNEYSEVLDRKFVSMVAELDELRVNLQSKDALLQTEKGKLVNLTRKCEALESSLVERTASSSSTLEIEQSVQPREKVMNVRGGARKGNTVNNNNNGDQVAIAIEMDDDANNRPLDEDDDKAHGFRALTRSRFVPRFTRPISDRIDGIWASGDRLLMRHPTLRLGVLLYWIALHAMLASFI